MILRNQKGVAIIMVLTAITILMAVMGDFTFETRLNKIKSYNLQDQIQARLTAEAGINLALIRLRLYKEAFNYIQGNKDVRDKVKMESVNQIWEVPFAFPIPTFKNMTAKQKAAIAKFMEASVLEGKLITTTKNISNLINLNLLRVSLFLNKEKSEQEKQNEEENSKEENTASEADTYKELVKLMATTIENRTKSDESFAERYAGVNVEELISIIKYYISDPDSEYEDVFKAGAENAFFDAKITPKHAPMSSQSELYLMPNWSDELLEVLQSEVTVHGNVMIDLNKITDKVLKLIIPGIDEKDTQDFFEYRDDPEDPHPFNSVEDFKNYVVSIGRLMSTEEFDKRMSEFEKANIKFGSAPTLFEVKSVAEFGRSTATVTAYISIPARPQFNFNTKANEDDDNDGIPNSEDEDYIPPQESEADKKKKEEEQTTQLLEPRIVEMIIK